MNHPDRHIAKRYDTPNRSRRFTDIVYTSGEHENPGALWEELRRAERSLDLPAPEPATARRRVRIKNVKLGD